MKKILLTLSIMLAACATTERFYPYVATDKRPEIGEGGFLETHIEKFDVAFFKVGLPEGHKCTLLGEYVATNPDGILLSKSDKAETIRGYGGNTAVSVIINTQHQSYLVYDCEK
jgi:hypothetical protein